MIKLPDKKYNIIYLDPPWHYRDTASAGKRGACFKYPVMSVEDIIRLPIQDIADDDCCMFMWVTMPKLDEVFDIFKAWGFSYKTCAFTWVKQNKIAETLFLGMGRWTRANAELCLLATKGSPKRVDAGVRSVVVDQVVYDHVREHSRKPDVVRDRIVQLCGDLPRIELFARESAENWDSWGLEVGKFDENNTQVE